MLRGLEQAHRAALDDHVHRPTRLGQWVLISGSWYKAIEQRLLHHRPLAHHQPVSPSRRLLNQDLTTSSSPIFSTPSAESGTTAFGLLRGKLDADLEDAVGSF